MRKRLVAALCILLLLTGLFPMASSAALDITFLAVNDEFPELTAETSPIRVGGVTYLPCTVFDKRSTGVDLGVSYGWDAKEDKISLYTKDRVLEFNVKTGIAYAYAEEREYNYQAVVRNGMPYVPAAAACRYFGLGCSFLATEDAQFQLIRIKNGKQILDDDMFMRSVRPHLEERAAKYSQTSGGTSNPSGGNSSGGGTVITPPNTSGEGSGQDVEVYLAVRVGNGAELSSIVKALKANRWVKGMFFFPVDELVDHDDLLRELISKGQRVGLIAQGTSLEEKQKSLEAGNLLLEHILRQRTAFVLDEGFSEEVKSGLSSEGYLPWRATVSVSSQNQSDSSVYGKVLSKIEESKGKARVLLDDGTKGGTLSSILRKLREDRYDIRPLRETDH